MRTAVVPTLAALALLLGGYVGIELHRSGRGNSQRPQHEQEVEEGKGSAPGERLESASSEREPQPRTPAEVLENRGASESRQPPLTSGLAPSPLVDDLEAYSPSLPDKAQRHFGAMVAALREWGSLQEPRKIPNLEGRFFDNMLYGQPESLAAEFALAWAEILAVVAGASLTREELGCLEEVLAAYSRIAAEEWSWIERSYRLVPANHNELALGAHLSAERERWAVYQTYWHEFVGELLGCLPDNHATGLRALLAEAQLSIE